MTLGGTSDTQVLAWQPHPMHNSMAPQILVEDLESDVKNMVLEVGI